MLMDRPLGRLASRVAAILRGKHRPYYDPSVDCGDYVIVINADKIHVTGVVWNKKCIIGIPAIRGLTAISLRDQRKSSYATSYGCRTWHAAKESLGRKMARS